MVNQVVADVSVEGSEFFSYIRLVYGLSLRFLYLCCPALNWYAITLIICMTGSFCIFMLLLSMAEQKSGRKQALLHAISFGVFYVLFVYNLFHLAFTNVAFFTTLSGGMLFLSQEPPYGKKKIGILIFSFLWFAYGASIRRYSALATFVILVGFACFCFVKMRTKKSILFLLAAVLVFGGYTYIRDCYIPEDDTNALYRYWSFEQARMVSVDRQVVSYEDHREEFEAIGISPDDYKLYYLWCYADYNVFHPETFGKLLCELTEETPPVKLSIGRVFKSMFTSIVNLAYMGLLLAVFLLGKKKHRLWLFLFCGCAEGMIFMLLLRGRLLWRMQLGVMQVAIIPVLLILLWGENHIPSAVFPFKKKPWLQSVCIFVVCALAVSMMAVRNGELIHAQKEKLETYAPIVNYVKAGSEQGKRFVSLAEHRVHFYYPEITLLQKREKPYYVNAGEADTFHPHWLKTMEQCGFSEFNDSVFRALIDGEEVYAFTDQRWNFDEVAGLLRRHYDESVEWVLEDKIGDWYIASFRRTK